MGARRDRIFANLDILFYDVTHRIGVVTIETRRVVRIFLDNLVSAGRSIVALPSSGNLRNAYQLVTFIEIGSLLVQVNGDRWAAADAVTIPVRNWVVSGSP